jgi:hypothetical protein
MSAPKPKVRNCVLCESTKKLTKHHFAGHNFDLTDALCDPCHLPITVGLRRLKIDTTGKIKGLEGLVHSLRATCYFQWVLLEHLEKAIRRSKGNRR